MNKPTTEDVADQINGKNVACRYADSNKASTDDDGTETLRNSGTAASRTSDGLCYQKDGASTIDVRQRDPEEAESIT